MTVGVQIFRILCRAQRQLFLLRMRPSQAKLAQIKRDQKTAFYALRNDFSDIYNKLKKYNIAQFTTRLWENYNAKSARTLERSIPELAPLLRRMFLNGLLERKTVRQRYPAPVSIKLVQAYRKIKNLSIEEVYNANGRV